MCRHFGQQKRSTGHIQSHPDSGPGIGISRLDFECDPKAPVDAGASLLSMKSWVGFGVFSVGIYYLQTKFVKLI